MFKILVVEDELYARESLIKLIREYDADGQFTVLQAVKWGRGGGCLAPRKAGTDPDRYSYAKKGRSCVISKYPEERQGNAGGDPERLFGF